jgi:hypothetical protein
MEKLSAKRMGDIDIKQEYLMKIWSTFALEQNPEETTGSGKNRRNSAWESDHGHVISFS